MAAETNSTIVSFSNAYHFITIKLISPSNYLFWRTQITLFLKARNLLGYVDGTHQCPHPVDPHYHLWLQQDTLIISLLTASLSEDVFPKVIGLETSHDIWTSLEKAFASPSINTHQSVQQAGDQSVTGQMDPGLYKSAQDGDIDVLRQNKDQLYVELTASGNTLLHVFAQFHDSAQCVDAILEMKSSTIKQSMLMWKNSKGETALHFAANNGRSNIVRALIGRAKALDRENLESGAKIAEEMMRETDQNGDTALHRAVRNKHAKVVKLLVEEDPDFPHSSNKMEETPLYLAVETRDLDIVDSILTACKSVAYGGPGGRTALHAAAIFDVPDCVAALLKKKKALTKQVDEFGWSPLHYAAAYNCVSSATKLLEADRSAAYIKADKDDNKTPLHVAAWQGNVEVMKELLKHCPDCWEMTTSKGQNVVHLAVDYGSQQVLDFVLSNPWAGNLINEKDDEGNTPLHLYATSYNLDGERLVEHLGADTNAYNKQNLTPLDMITNLKHFSFHEDSIKKELRRKGGHLGYRNVIQRDH